MSGDWDWMDSYDPYESPVDDLDDYCELLDEIIWAVLDGDNF